MCSDEILLYCCSVYLQQAIQHMWMCITEVFSWVSVVLRDNMLEVYWCQQLQVNKAFCVYIYLHLHHLCINGF